MGDPYSSDDVVNAFDDLVPNAVFSWTQIGYSSLTTALGYSQGIVQAVKTAAGAVVLFVAYQTGTKGLTGVVYQKSTDGGETWDGEVQISSRQTHASMAAVINPDTYDIHFVYATLGDPALGAGLNSLYRRVLAWGAIDWSVGAEATIFSGAAASGVTNVTMEPRISGTNGYLMALTHYHNSANNRYLESSKATSSWTLTSGNNDNEIQFVDAIELRCKLLRDNTHALWIVIVEQGGTWQVYTSKEVTPPGEITLDPYQAWYEPTTAEFDAAVDPVTGLVGIVQNSANQILYRTYNPATNVLTSSVVVDDGLSGNCYSPAITLDAGRFMIAYARTVAGDQRQLMAAWSSDWNAKLTLATDPGVIGTYGAWSEVHLARGTQDISALYVAWCDSVAPDAAGCRVYVGRLPVPFSVPITDAVHATETPLPVLTMPLADAVTAVDTVRATEPVAVADTLAADDEPQYGPTVADVASIAETFNMAVDMVDAVKATEVTPLMIETQAIDALAAADTVFLTEQHVLADTVHATDLVTQIKLACADVVAADDVASNIAMALTDTVHAADLIELAVDVAETLAAAEALVIGISVNETVATADEIFSALFEVLDDVTATDLVTGLSMELADVLSAVDTIGLQIQVGDTLHVTESAAKLALYRLLVRLLMHSGKVRLKLEGGGDARQS